MKYLKLFKEPPTEEELKSMGDLPNSIFKVQNNDAVYYGSASEQTENILEEPAPTAINKEYVDLGLSVKWMECNLNVDNKYTSGELYTWCSADLPNSECVTKSNVLYARYDIVRQTYGKNYRMPTKTEFAELINNCDWKLTINDGGNVLTGTSQKNGNTIILPIGGIEVDGKTYFEGDQCGYWTSSLGGSNPIDMFFTGEKIQLSEDSPNFKLCIRGVYCG